VAEWFQIFGAEARSILSRTTGFLAEAGFSHSLSPARNCTFGCSYCYVPTMRIQGGLKREDWERWGQFTTFKNNASELLRGAISPDCGLYCSPVVDPYQPAEEPRRAMPAILDALRACPPRVFVLQTRGSLVLRDLGLILRLAERTLVRVSFSLTTDSESVRRQYEPHCSAPQERLEVMGRLTAAGIETYATLAPVLPCDPERLAGMALEATRQDVIGDPFHTRMLKRSGATTREAGLAVSRKHRWEQWHDPDFQRVIGERIRAVVEAAGRRYVTGPAGFGLLARHPRGSAGLEP
jgi:DNA repair photolyase